MANNYLELSEELQTNVLEYMPEPKMLEHLSSFFGVFSDPTRVKIICALSISPMCVNDLSNILGINQTTISHQLKLLYDNRIVERKRSGKILFYSICYTGVSDVLETGTNYVLA